MVKINLQTWHRPGAIMFCLLAAVCTDFNSRSEPVSRLQGSLRVQDPEQAYSLCLGGLSLTREYPPERVNNSCRLANTEGLTRLKQIKSILKNNRDLVPVDGALHPSQELPLEHENIRGSLHFH